MAYGHSYSYVTTASVPRKGWAIVQPLLEARKSVLQDLPGFVGCDVIARTLENGDLLCQVRVSWLYAEQVEEFAKSVWETEYMINATHTGPYDMRSEMFEHFT